MYTYIHGKHNIYFDCDCIRNYRIVLHLNKYDIHFCILYCKYLMADFCLVCYGEKSFKDQVHAIL